jgi:hypothetical protein
LIGVKVELTAYAVETVEIYDGWVVGAIKGNGLLTKVWGTLVNPSPTGHNGYKFISDFMNSADPRTIHLPTLLTDLMNATDAQKIKRFVRTTGIVEFSALFDSAIAKAPASVKSAWKKVATSARSPFAVSLESINQARIEARKMLDAKEAAGGDVGWFLARLGLKDLLNKNLREAHLIAVDKDSGFALCVSARTIEAAVAMAVLGEVINPQIRVCIRCGEHFQWCRKKQCFCSPNCKSAFHMAKQREKAKQRKSSHGKRGRNKQRPPTRVP